MAGLSLFLVLVLGVVVWLSRHDSTYHAPTTGGVGPTAEPDRAAAVLRDLQQAVTRHDSPQAAALGATPAARTLLRAVVRNGEAVHVTGFSLRYLDEAGGVSTTGAWTAYVHASWTFAGFDARPEALEVRVRFARAGDGLGIAAIGGGDRRSPLWLTAPLQVRRSPGSMVLVRGPRGEADRFARLAARAVPQVRQVLPGWRGGLVLEVPRNETGLQRALDAKPAQYTGIAAVTINAGDSPSRSDPAHVFVNPAVFLPLKGRGAQVVATHEATHVATHGSSSPSPTWLVEGFADYVALRAQPIPLARTAARIAALVRREGPPSSLPGPTEFAAGSPHLEARYESAWLACRLLAGAGGQSALVAFYRAVDGGHPVGAELGSHFGFGERELVRRWRTLLAHLPA